MGVNERLACAAVFQKQNGFAGRGLQDMGPAIPAKGTACIPAPTGAR